MNTKYLFLGVSAVAAIAAFGFLRLEPKQDIAQDAPATQTATDTAMVAIAMPEISGNAAIGQNIFENICAACHGAQGVGNAEAGPPLIHKIYEPSHHGDESFQRAVAHGVRAHHWRFGDMPPVGGLTRGDIAMVIDYIRAIQRANGIN
ncbi:putative bifunctional cbb3-type cytochrome c oxidase subunit II/cytochrome c [Tritonibacter multivorans]|uniref:Putative bifunctional cbb3-type cytochrome c oxidase subunit II/cytochrome c n=1 Tax=Tritonibacter multivorans TaxID=928856 RepID=A0A0P1G9I9_9RHOB|nr:cytochrome c [Tritonibacter multivorans]MDA7422886.1 cytochrome c [Tritonibacter multivorans]CUH78212.1 putative bifunctional cbb3-type cytochrome c oxidase subunit II/cytochrome c [Tritonibacter multivorans]SFD63026.1 Cytochrome C oxidase, cbb3-type, subunit III [Tritonibacter multivorans]